MPGLVGVFAKHSGLKRDDLRRLVERMTGSLTYAEGRKIDVWGDDAFCGGRVHLGVLDAARQPLDSPTTRARLFFDGEVFTSHDSCGRTPTVDEVAAWLANPRERLAEVDGRYQLAYYDPEARRLSLAVDPLGLRRLYVLETRDWLAFAGEIKALLAISVDEPQIDRSGLSEFLCFGHLLGDRTLWQGIAALPPASVRTIQRAVDTDDATCGFAHDDTERYWSINTLPVDPIRDEREAFSEFARLWTIAVRQRTRPGRMPLLLSGGLDSRFLLAELCEQDHEVVAFTVGDENSSDPQIAARAAAVAGVPHVVFPISCENWWEGRETAVWRLDGRQTLRHFHASVIGDAWRTTNRYAPINVAGDAVFGGSWMKSREGSKHSRNLRDILPRNYRRNPWVDVDACVALVAKHQPEGLDGPSPDTFWLRNRVPQSAIATWEAVGEFEQAYPSMSLPLLSFVYGKLTDAQREGGSFYRRFLAWRFPAYFRDIPNQKTGRGLNETWGRRFSRAAQAAVAVCRLKRPPRVGPPGIADYRVLVRHKMDASAPFSGPLLVDEYLDGTAERFLRVEREQLTDPRTVLGIWTLELYLRQVRALRREQHQMPTEILSV